MSISSEYLESVPGMELLTRTSMHSLRNPSQVSIFLRETLTQEIDERNWSWISLRAQFRNKGLEKLYRLYQRRLQHAYFSIFLVMQMTCSLAQLSVLLSTSSVKIEAMVPDIICYTLLALLCVPLLFLSCTERLMPFSGARWLPVVVSVTMLLALLAADIAPPTAHLLFSDLRLRPMYSPHTVLACYVFLPLPTDPLAILFGLLATTAHIAALATVSYSTQDANYVQRLLGESLFLLSVNGLGLYFRLVSEVVVRRTFLDRRACVESTCKLNYEKEQEEQLMLSILPRHIATQVKEDIRSIFQHIQNYRTTPLRKKPFSQLYVQKHENVSILYADVVEFAKLTVTLPVNKLVETLNELFGRFDEASEEHDVLRIKFLGDCYYCVAGVPTPNPQHAKSCVELGLDMIAIIREVRDERRLNIDMRIGIHSGKILSGLLGVCKWQFDVWSRDVIIANHMEQSGKPGKVHVTGQTRKLLGNEYEYEPGHGAIKDPLLAKYKIKTYLISPKDKGNPERTFIPRQHQSRRSSQLFSKIQEQYKSGSLLVPRPSHSRQVRRSTTGEGSGSVSPARRRTVFMDSNLYVYQQMLKMTDAHMADAIDKMPLRKVDQWFHSEKIHPVLLKFEPVSWEWPFLKQPDPLFKFYLACSLFALVCMLGLQVLAMQSAPLASWLTYCGALIVLFLLTPSSWTAFLWNHWSDPDNEMDRIPPPENRILLTLYSWSHHVSRNVLTRCLLYLLVTAALAVCAFSNLIIECNDEENATYINKPRRICDTPWHVTEACSLAILTTLMFLRIHFLLKLITNCVLISIYTYFVWDPDSELFLNGAETNPGLSRQVSHTLFITFLALCVHFMDRQSDYMNRLDFCWKRQLLAEQDEATTTRKVNKMLLQNILPEHVADVYLNMNRPHDELFHEEYDNVAVVFASLAGYSLHDDEAGAEEDGLHDDGMGGLKLLNEIITDFDKLLFDPEFRRVEKIKVAGYTYMAACGLEPGRRDSNASWVSSTSNNEETETGRTDHAVVLARFATRMMAVLRALNKDAFQAFNLRVGICHGRVMAGVVGEKKPLYDIWGDTVNMASRMDSTGIPGSIQVLESTARVLESHGVKCEQRGMTFVKGKGQVMTYFVPVDSEFQLLPNDSPPPFEEESSL